jgi:peptidoglycan/LPS O-acetylase OafA/YrhL
MASDPKKPSFRTDIQVLRGFAVLVVLLYHAKLPWFSAGYLGVDSFFVISGFLITSIITQDLELGRFSLTKFYARRAKRLIPAAYVTFIITTAVSFFILGKSELYDYFLQTLGAVSFTANIFLWKQTGYFEGAGDLKPLLHTWSLSIEEQYYLVFPAVLMFVRRQYWAALIVGVACASLLLALVFSTKQSEAFYLLPFRAWELLLGSLGALAFRRNWIKHIPSFVFYAALAVLITLPLFGIRIRGFDIGAVLVCCATLIILLKNSPTLYSGFVPLALARIGDFSYSLYLVHWPIFALFYNTWISGSESVSLAIRWLLMGVSIVLAYLLHISVEKPIHHKQGVTDKNIFIASAIASLLVIGFAASLVMTRHTDGGTLGPARKINAGFDLSCDSGALFEVTTRCGNSIKPKIMVWGDSYAMHLIPGLAENAAAGKSDLIQATKSACAPLIGLAFVERKGYDRKWAEQCIAFNDSVISYLSSNSSVDVVVLSSPFTQLLGVGTVLERRSTVGDASVVAQSQEAAVQGLTRTINALRTIGKRVVLVAPPPVADFDIGKCQERVMSKLPVFTKSDSCTILDEDRQRLQKNVLSFLSLKQVSDQIRIISFADFLCKSGVCETAINGVSLYNDKGHLSPSGSKLLAARLQLTDAVQKLAR